MIRTKTGATPTTALLVIDIINSCCHENYEKPQWGIRFSKIRRMVPKLERFIARYKQGAGGVVIYTRTVPWIKAHLPENVNDLYITNPAARYYTTDTSGFAEQFFQVCPQKEDVVVSKNQYDVFTDPELIKILKKKKIRNIIVTGVFGDGCVLASICGAFSKGYQLMMITDLIETTDVPIRQRLQKDLKTFTWPIMYGRTISVKEFLKNA